MWHATFRHITTWMNCRSGWIGINTLNPGRYFIEVHAKSELPQMLCFMKTR
jgi:hypothetical protein